MAYARPVLCRLCGFPAPDGGVPVSQVDREKLSEWCLRMMDTELDQDGLDEAVLCSFCVWQAKFNNENHDPFEEGESNLPIWWKWQGDSFRRTDNGYKSYFLDDLIKPCAVTIPVMSKDALQRYGLLADSGTHQTEKRGHPMISNCIYCSAQFESKTALIKHVKEQHQHDSTFRCNTCNQFFLSRQERKDHIEKVHPSLKCPLCAHRVAKFYILANHLKLKHKTNVFKCKYGCGDIFFTEELRREHVQAKHEGGGRVNCIYCNKQFWKNKLPAHMKSMHNSLYIRCEYVANCVSFFHTEEEKDKHILEEHKIGFDRVDCIYCQKKILRAAIAVHIKNKHQKVLIKCHYNKCTSYFHTQEEKKKHILEVHESGSDKYRCIYCNLVMKNSNENIIRHMKRHHKTDAIKCDYQFHCPNYFLTQEEKQKHVLEVHESGEDKIRCEFCSRMVNIKGLMGHIRLQHRSGSKGQDIQEERVECIYCKRQIKKVSISVHMAHKHKTEAIKCNFHKFCSFYFLTVEDRQKHIAEVHMVGKEVRLTCQFCKIMFSDSTTLRCHMKVKHPEAIKCNLYACWEYFSSKEEGEKHLKNAHDSEEKGKTFKCFHCSFTATSREVRNTHSAQVHIRATLRCPKCPKMFKSNSSLKDHLNSSHGAKQNCPHCLELVRKRIWAKHLHKTFCATCKAIFMCRGIRLKHPRKCIRQYKRSVQ